MEFIWKYILLYLDEVMRLTMEMAPYLLLGFLFAGILHVYFPRDKVVRFMGQSNLGSVVNASLLGVPLPLCSCGVIPTGISFFKSGASRGSTVSFLISTPQTGVDSIMATGALLGWPMAVLRPLIAFVTGIFGGVLTNWSYRNAGGNQASALSDVAELSRFRYKNRFFELFRYAFLEFLQDIAKWLLIGILLAGLISVLVPDDFFSAYLGNNLLSMIIILLISVPLYVCATGSIPIAAILMLKGLSPGAAIVFLMAGPATNIATMTVVGKVMGRKTLFLYLVSIMGGAMVSGLLIDWLIPAGWLTSHMQTMHLGHEHRLFPLWAEAGMAILLSGLIINGLLHRYTRLFEKRNTETIKHEITMEEIKVRVSGMTCNHCKMNVEKQVKGIEGVENAAVDLASATVTIQGSKLDLVQIKSSVESIGYQFGGKV
ncbi:MAG: permease [Bacteroidales bacterium]